MSEKDIWNEDDTSSNRDDVLNNYGLPKKRSMTKFHQDSIVLSSPQLELPGYSCNRSEINEHMEHFSDAKWNPKYLHTDCSTNNSLIVKEPSAVSFHFDDDGENIDDDFNEPFLKSCSTRMDVLPVAGSTRGDDEFRFQADRFKKWLYMDDRVDYEEEAEADYIIQGPGPWFDEAATVWSPRRTSTTSNVGTDFHLLSNAPLDSILSGGDCLEEDNSHWISPVAKIQYSKSSNPSSKCDWSTISEKMHVEPVTDVVSKRHFKHGRNGVLDLCAFEERETDIFNFDDMRSISSWEDSKKSIRKSQNDSILFPQRCDSLYEKERAFSPVAASRHVSLSSYTDAGKTKIGQYRFQNKQRRRSCSAPPFYRGKKKIIALNSWMTVNSEKPHQETNPNAPTLQEDSHLKHIQKPSGVDHLAVTEGSAHNLWSKARHDEKKIIDKAEISDSEAEVAHCLDIYLPSVVETLIENHGGLDFGGKWRDGCHWTSSTKKPDDIVNEDSILDISSGILQLSGDSVLPKFISKKCLEDCRVLQQVDRKFIPVIGGGIVAIIDQHAADERIRLEDLREKVLSGEAKTITYLDAEQELVLPEIGYQLLNNYSEQIQKWGWICNFHAQSSVSFKKNLNFLHNQPSVATLIAVPCILGVNLTDVDLLEFLQQLADTDGSSAIPPAVLRVLNLKACRGAIMFGDALLPSECSLIVEELKQTSMCFQCAHGRPTTVPLVNLVVLHKQIAKLGNWSPGSSGPWHGLSRHRPSLERVAQRLSSEGGQC